MYGFWICMVSLYSYSLQYYYYTISNFYILEMWNRVKYDIAVPKMTLKTFQTWFGKPRKDPMVKPY